jgi:hypothetical protein
MWKSIAFGTVFSIFDFKSLRIMRIQGISLIPPNIGFTPAPPHPQILYTIVLKMPQKALTQNINNGANIDMRQKEGWRGEGGGGLC